ncbi:MAG: hypothetical protein AAF590_09615 [Pseudomonadota bacterium]
MGASAITIRGVATDNDEDRRVAIAFMLEAFDAGCDAGIDKGSLTRAALFQSIMQIVDELGEEDAARFLRISAVGVQSGYYSRADQIN